MCRNVEKGQQQLLCLFFPHCTLHLKSSVSGQSLCSRLDVLKPHTDLGGGAGVKFPLSKECEKVVMDVFVQ